MSDVSGTPTDDTATTGTTSTPSTSDAKQSRWALVRQIRDHPGDQEALWLMLALWVGAAVLGMVAVGSGNPFGMIALIVFAVDAIALGVMMLAWSWLNTGIILATHTVLVSVSVLSGNLSALAVVSVAVMFGAAEAGQNWWARIADRDEDADGATIVDLPDRRWASLEVAAIAGAAAALVGVLGFFESRIATVAAIGVFVTLVIGAIVLQRSD